MTKLSSINFSELNYCEKNQDTCKNGGKCQSLESGDGFYRCQCPPGISGKNCENLPDSMTTPAANITEVPEVTPTSEAPEEVEETDENSSVKPNDTSGLNNGENETE